MKRFADRLPANRLRHGYLAPCRKCGLVVVHSHKHDEPFHMHRYSKLCKSTAALHRRIPRRANVYLNSKLIAELESIDMSFRSRTIELTANVIRFVPGDNGAMETAMNTQTFVTIAWVSGKKQIRFQVCKCVSWTLSKRAVGSMTGAFCFRSAEGW